MHVIWREGWQDQDYLDRYCVGVSELRERVMREYPIPRVSHITGLSVEEIELLLEAGYAGADASLRARGFAENEPKADLHYLIYR